MTHETGERVMPFPTLVISETDLSLMDQTESYGHVIDRLKQANLYDPDLLYSGIDDAGDLIAAKTFGDRTKTWAVDETHFRDSAADADHYGASQSGAYHSPLRYALTGGYMPALAVYNKAAFVNMADIDYEKYTEYEWQLRPGQTMDQATRAVIYLF